MLAAAAPVVQHQRSRFSQTKKPRTEATRRVDAAGNHAEEASSSFEGIPSAASGQDFQGIVADLACRYPEVHRSLIASILRNSKSNITETEKVMQQISHSQRQFSTFIASSHANDTDCARVSKNKRSVRPFDHMSDDDLGGPVSVKEADFPSEEATVRAAASVSTSNLVHLENSSVSPLAPSLLQTPTSLESANQQKAVQMLSRVVIKQSERMKLLQMESRRIADENSRLHGQVAALTNELRRARELYHALAYKLSNLDDTGDGSNGGARQASASDFNPLRRLPDVF